jgi:hypothetical protein
MATKLFTQYSYDECSYQDELFNRLKNLLEDGKINYKIEDSYVFKLQDLELTDNEIDELLNFFDELNVFEYVGYDYGDEDLDYDDDYVDEDEDDFGYNRKGRYNSEDDDY